MTSQAIELCLLVFQVVFYSCFGTFCSFALVKRAYAGPRFFFYHGLGAVALLSGAYGVLAWSFLSLAQTATFVVCMTAIVLYSMVREDFHKLQHFYFGVGALSGLSLLWSLAAAAPFPLWSFANAVLASGLLGLSLGAMLLGHWYLIEPKLPISELKKLTLGLLVLLGLRVCFSMLNAYFLLQGMEDVEIARFLMGSTPGLFSLMRWAWGLGIPLVLGVLIWQTVKIRSTQSATGMLYILVLGVLTGEILSQYLSQAYQLLG